MPPPPPPTVGKLVAVFLGGCVVIAVTTWDVHRNIQLNDRPVTLEQQAALEDWLARKGWKDDKEPGSSVGGSSSSGSGSVSARW